MKKSATSPEDDVLREPDRLRLVCEEDKEGSRFGGILEHPGAKLVNRSSSSYATGEEAKTGPSI
jgi:hypothetical protein